MQRFRLAFWMTDPPGAPGDVVEVPDDRVDELVRAGIGRPEDSAPPPDDPAVGVPDEELAAPPAGRGKSAKATTKTD